MPRLVSPLTISVHAVCDDKGILIHTDVLFAWDQGQRDVVQPFGEESEAYLHLMAIFLRAVSSVTSYGPLKRTLRPMLRRLRSVRSIVDMLGGGKRQHRRMLRQMLSEAARLVIRWSWAAWPIWRSAEIVPKSNRRLRLLAGGNTKCHVLQQPSLCYDRNMQSR